MRAIGLRQLAYQALIVGVLRREFGMGLGDLIKHVGKAVAETQDQLNKTMVETARRLGLSLSGAKSRVQRARQMLHERLLACCRVELDGRGAIVDYEARGACGPGEAASGAGCGCQGA